MRASFHRRPELTVDELYQLKWMLGGLITLLGVGTVLYMDVDAWALLAITVVLTLTVLLRPTLPARVPPLVHTLAFPAIVGFFAVDLWLKTEVLPAMVRLDMLLLLYRCINYRQRRDDLQIIVLGLFLIVVAGVLTVSLLFAVHLLVYTGCALALLLVLTLLDGATAGQPAGPPAPGEAPGWARHAHWGQLLRRLRDVLDWRVLVLGGLLFAGVVGVTALLFMLIPRFQLESSMFLDRIISKKSRSGFTDTIRFGEVSEIQQDTSVALNIDVSDPAQIPASPYWRMLVLDVYDAGGFRLSRELRNQEFERPRTGVHIGGAARAKRGEPVVWTFFLEAGVSRYLPVVGPFESLRFREAQNFTYARRLSVLALRDEPVSMTAYRVEGFDLASSLPDAPFAAQWKARAEPTPRGVTLQTGLPKFPRPIDLALLRRALAEATGGDTLTTPEFVRRVNAWLRANHSYSLSPSIPTGDGDPLVKWLTSREAGHCELFAGSFVLMARAAGYPARVVTGFRGGSWNGYSESFTIRNSDAHAWAEIFDEQTGAWLRSDPLAAASEAQGGPANVATTTAGRLDRSWKARLDSLRVFWYRRIVSFDQGSQVETLKAVKDATQSTGRRIREAITAMGEAVKAWLASPWDSGRLAYLLAWVAAGVAAIVGWRRLGRDRLRGWWHVGRGGRRDDPVRREAGRWLERLTVRGEGAAPEADVVAELQRLRFGARATWTTPEQVFRRARREVRERGRRKL